MNDGGPAFPRVGWSEGMSLRDYFAGQALLKIVDGSIIDYEQLDVRAYIAYKYADIMLRERGKTYADR